MDISQRITYLVPEYSDPKDNVTTAIKKFLLGY